MEQGNVCKSSYKLADKIKSHRSLISGIIKEHVLPTSPWYRGPPTFVNTSNLVIFHPQCRMPEAALSRRGIANTLCHLERSRWRDSRIHTGCFLQYNVSPSSSLLNLVELKQLCLLPYWYSHPPNIKYTAWNVYIILAYEAQCSHQ